MYQRRLVPKVVGTVLMVFSTNKGRSTEGAFSKRAVNRGRFFEEGGQQRALFRRGRSTEAAFSKRTINRGREGSTAANRKRLY